MGNTPWKDMTPDQKASHSRAVHKYYKKNIDKARKRVKDWQHSEKYKEYVSRPKSVELHAIRAKKYRESHKVAIGAYNMARKDRLKEIVILAYGGCCPNCDQKDYDKLTVDHVAQKNADGFGGVKLYSKIVKLGFPEEYRVLCRNCNRKAWIIYRQSVNSKSKIAIKARGTAKRRKLEILNKYGGCFCQKCGIADIDVLTIDHVNGGGNSHRKELLKIGTNLYQSLKKNGFPEGYRVLCQSCNFKEYLLSRDKP